MLATLSAPAVFTLQALRFGKMAALLAVRCTLVRHVPKCTLFAHPPLVLLVLASH